MHALMKKKMKKKMKWWIYFFWAASAALARASSEANLSSSLVIRLLPPSKQPKHNPMVSCFSPSPLSPSLSVCHPTLCSFSLLFSLLFLPPHASTNCIFPFFLGFLFLSIVDSVMMTKMLY